ncbi:unnamed protein product [Protopolystoma xenopodis]|uniref:Ig-like domain-containing protein n=1 Tax=Protopolystoma xenopodis TaxID=117903 RepID=A0A3S5BUF7_9PLAT|nr:unnamed protein product [Protopolystoma xenopodis]
MRLVVRLSSSLSCDACDFGGVESKQLIVFCAPQIEAEPIVYAGLGAPVQLRCSVKSVPLPPMNSQTFWHFRGSSIRESMRAKYIMLSGLSHSTSEPGIQVSDDDAGMPGTM